MGTVWRAADTLLHRDVAVKEVLLPRAMPKAEREALCERTLREARAAAALSHPSVVQVYDVVTDGGRPWIVMELLDARSLADMIIDDGPLPQRTVAKIGIAMLGALEVAHAAGVLHRDVKPANVLICVDGRCVLTDFGVARLPTESKLTTPGMVLGSPHFISPERAVGGTFGPPSDLFSLGVTLYTAVEGGPPFDRGDPFETMRAVVEEEPRPARLAGPLQPVLLGLLEKEPARRWRVEHARSTLRELLTGTLSRPGSPIRQDTDPHAVIRPRPPDAADGATAGAEPTGPVRRYGKVGGRALLDPDESLTGQLARLRAQSDRPGPTPLPGTDEWHTTEPPAPRRPEGRRPGTMRAPSRGAVLADDVAGRVRALREQAPAKIRDLSQRAPAGVRALGEKARRPQNRSRLIVAAGLVAVLALAVIGAVSGLFGSGGNQTPGPSGSAAPTANAGPLIDVQTYSDPRGITINVPEGWTKTTASSYVDFTDESASQVRKVRINVEDYSGTAQRYLQGAENGLKNPERCPSPYQRVALNEAELDGRPGAELEYTCGEGVEMRHGIWRAIVVDGKAYHFYLTVPDNEFDESEVIYQEMVRSFRLTL
jgi:eukaryotic-like serine/threonine-protein kinase